MNANQEYADRVAELGQLLSTKPLVRAINFHNTSQERAHIFGRQLEICSRRFTSVSEDDLDAYLQTGRWHKDKPGVILAFYEGYRNGFDIVRPMLDELGLTGWFFVITGFVDAPREEQLDYAIAHDIGIESYVYDDGRYAMSWSELRELDRSHVIASHALSHESIAPKTEEQRIDEVIGSQQSFIDGLGHPVRTFVSRGGPAYGEHEATDRLIDAAGYQFVFSNFRIQRLRDQRPA